MRKYYTCLCAALLGSVLLLTGCGDDASVSVNGIAPQKIESLPMDEQAGVASVSDTLPEADESMQADILLAEEKMAEEKTAEEETTEASRESAVEPEQISITISAAGDVTMGNYIGQGYENSFRQTYEKQEDKNYFFQNVYDIFSQDDMTIVNLEGTLTFSEEAAPGRTYNIKGDPEYAYLLNYGSIEAVSMANNHRMDFGEEGAKDSVEAVKSAGIAYAYDSVLGVYEVKGIRIGWVSVNEIAYGTGIEKFLEDGINRLKEEGVNLILACCHWGIERENYPEDYQMKVGRKCIDWGADLVIGHHPHVLQGIEEYQGKYIIYSLGNFCFGANRNPADKDTMIFQQTFEFTKLETEDAYGPAVSGEARIIPCSVSSVTSRNDYCPTPLTGEDGERVIGRVNEYSKDFGVMVDAEGVLTSVE